MEIQLIILINKINYTSIKRLKIKYSRISIDNIIKHAIKGGHNLKISPIIETDRLVLRNFKEKDIDILYSYRNNKNCSKYQRWENTSKEFLINFIKEERLKTISNDSLQLAIAHKKNDDLVGDIFIARKEKCITIGYTVDFKHHRKGYAHEIINALISYLFDNFKGYELVALVHPDNEPSKNLLEKLNFESEGYAEKLDSIVYCLKSFK